MLFPKSLLLLPKQELVFRDIFLVNILTNAVQVVMILLVYFKYSGLNFLSFFSAVCSSCQFSMLRRRCPLDIYLLLPCRLRGSIITFSLTIVFSVQIIFCFAAHRTAYPFTVSGVYNMRKTLSSLFLHYHPQYKCQRVLILDLHKPHLCLLFGNPGMHITVNALHSNVLIWPPSTPN